MAALRDIQSATGEPSPPKGIIRIVQHEKPVNFSNEKDAEKGDPHANQNPMSSTNIKAEMMQDSFKNHHNHQNGDRHAFNRHTVLENEFSRARNDISRARNEISKVQNEMFRAQNEISRGQNEIFGARNILERAGISKQDPNSTSQDISNPSNHQTKNIPKEGNSKRSGRSNKSMINDGEQSEASDGRTSSKRHGASHQYQHQHQNYHNHQHHSQRRDMGEESRRRYNTGRGGGGHHTTMRENDSIHGSRLDDSNMAGPSNAIGSGSRSAIGTSSSQKLFDPRKDDPVRFAASRKGLGITPSIETASMSDSRSFASSVAPSTTTMSTVSSEGRERRRRRGGPGSRTTTDSGEGGAGGSGAGTGKRKGQGGGDGAMSDNNSYVIELKRRYRDVVVLERKLQEEHKLAAEQERKYQTDQQNAQMSTGNMARSSSSHKQHSHRLGFNSDGSLIYSYWLELIAKHRNLAELHVAFMEAALRPGLPASLHSLPQSYKIPTRLWHTAFHSLLERFRQSLPDWQACIAMRETGVPVKDRERFNETVDLFTEYIYFAYSYYTNLLESELFKVFRSSWIENLGDLARYRMAVAKIMSYLGIRDGVRHGAERRDSGTFNRPSNDRHSSSETQTPSFGKNEKHKEEEEEALGQEEEALEVLSAQMGKDRASIGIAAAQDWDLEEKEIWRSTARGWYAKGLADVPGTGRLHHHLGILSRDDDLRSLYHFSKSLTASHPYTNARESILPLFERSSQARRILIENNSIIDLFVYMHGVLFTRIQMDDFESVFVRFKQLLNNHLRQREYGNAVDAILLSPSSWMMMATINIAAILQYGSIQESIQTTTAEQSKDKDNKDAKQSTIPSTEDDEADGDDDDEAGEEIEEDEEKDDRDEKDDQNESKGQSEIIELPSATQKACRLAFGMLEILISHFIDNTKHAANPYMTLLLTFFSQECKNGDILRKLERYVPWETLVSLGNSIPSSVEPIDPRNDTTLKIRGDAIPLPEDWCLRGMAWVGRRVYERGFWKPHKVERLGLRSSLSLFENELDMIDRCTRCTEKSDDLRSNSSTNTSKDVPHQHHDDQDNDEDEDDDDEDEDDDGGRLIHSVNRSSHIEERSNRPKLTLTLLRWKRIVHALTILIKTVPGMDFDISIGNVHARHGRLILAPPLNRKVVDWRAEETRAEVENAIGHINLAKLEGRLSPNKENSDIAIYTHDEADEDGEMKIPFVESENESEEVQKLIEMRTKLRKQLQDAKSVNHLRPIDLKVDQKSHQKADKFTKPFVRLVSGYTTLLLDTNVMLTPTDILSQLIKSKRWMIVIPLPVITELDGLKRREGDVGKRAKDAIQFLESKIQSHSTQLKVQTSRGNYLSDLRFRTEDIDFSAEKVDNSENERNDSQIKDLSEVIDSTEDQKVVTMARSVDDVILRCLTWQAGSHFRNRLLLLCPDDDERSKKEEEISKNISPSVARAVLVTLDRNLRIKARFHQLSAIGPSELIEILLQDSRKEK